MIRFKDYKVDRNCSQTMALYPDENLGFIASRAPRPLKESSDFMAKEAYEVVAYSIP